MKSCAETRFIVCDKKDDVTKILAAIEQDPAEIKSNEYDRGYFLNLILKYVGDDVWNIADK